MWLGHWVLKSQGPHLLGSLLLLSPFANYLRALLFFFLLLLLHSSKKNKQLILFFYLIGCSHNNSLECRNSSQRIGGEKKRKKEKSQLLYHIGIEGPHVVMEKWFLLGRFFEETVGLLWKIVISIAIYLVVNLCIDICWSRWEFFELNYNNINLLLWEFCKLMTDLSGLMCIKFLNIMEIMKT